MKKKKTAIYWLKELFLFSLILIVFSIGMDLWRKQDMPSYNVPPMKGETLTGMPIDVLEMSKNKPVIVYFWATWCGACQFVTPTINSFSDSYHVVGIPLRSGTNEKLSRYMKAKDYHFPNINDHLGEISNAWGVLVTPTIIIIDNAKIKSITTGITTPWGLQARLWLTLPF